MISRSEPRSLPELLLSRAEDADQSRATVVIEGGRSLCPAELASQAMLAARGFCQAKARAGQPVLLLIRDIEDFLVAFWGALFAGLVPAPLAGPRDASERELERILKVVRVLADPLIVVDRNLTTLAPPGLEFLDIGELRRAGPGLVVDSENPLALIQFSSGSTRDPRGVMLDHANILANLRQFTSAVHFDSSDIALTWMPHHHDMGLIGGYLGPLFVGARQVRMDPVHAMADPLQWLESAAKHRATVLTSTCLGLSRATKALRTRAPGAIDFSSVRIVATGAEPLDPNVLRDFSRVTGIPEEAHRPMYGLAEATVCVSAPTRGGIRTVDIDGRRRLLLGPPVQDMRVRIVDEKGHELPEGSEGELEIAGPNVTHGYYLDEPATKEIKPSEFVRTGDIAQIVGGEIVIVGRQKDVVIVDGRKLHAHDIEFAAESIPGVRTGAAVFVADARGIPERPTIGVMLAEGAEGFRVIPEIRKRLTAEIGAVPWVFPLPKIPRTTSGKKRRAQVRADVESGIYDHAVHPTTVGLVRQSFAQALGRSLGDHELDVPFALLGGTSLMATKVINSLEMSIGIAPDHRLLMRGDTVHRLARILEQDVDPEEHTSSRQTNSQDKRIAIVALACRVPGARGPATFLEVAKNELTQIGLPKAGRKGGPGGYIDDVDLFDAQRFRVPPDEAAAMDPQQRLMLAIADEALSRAGLDLHTFGRDIGVFIGAGHPAYIEHVLAHVENDVSALPPGTLAGNLLSMLAARIAHSFDLRGPALTIDTACSSSLVALHVACQSIRAGECAAAIVGGVFLNLTPTLGLLFARAGALSPSGRCRPFEPDADGTVPGEGVLATVLVPFEIAEQNGLPVLAVIHGSAINNDGASLGVMAPNPAGQESVIRRALESSGIDAARISIVEAHGTATRVGDEVERAVLRRVYAHGPKVIAVKGIIGHLMAAAGIAGLARLALELQSGEFGAVSSFGFGGTNAHVIVEGVKRRMSNAALADGPRAGQRHWLREIPRVDRRNPVFQLFVLNGEGRLELAQTNHPPSLRGSSVIVTGGTGALGRALVDELAPHVAHMLLVGKRPLDSDVEALLLRARSLGAAMTYCSADLTTSSGCRAVRAAAALLPPVDVLFHLAGNLDAERCLATKRDALLRLESIDFKELVCASSISACFPGLDRGIEEYAAANRALDEYAKNARAQGAPFVSVALPPLTGGGLAEPFRAVIEKNKLPTLDMKSAANALLAARGVNAGHVVALPEGAAAAFSFASPSKVPTTIVDAKVPTTLDMLREFVAKALEKPPLEVDIDVSFPALGLDSLTALDIIKFVETKLGQTLPSTLLYEHDTIAKAALAIDALMQNPLSPALPMRETGQGSEASGGEALLPSQLSFVAQRSFFPDMPGNVLLAARVDDGGPPLEREELQNAVAILVARHPALAAVITRNGAHYVQVPGPGPEICIVSALDATAEDAIADEPFDLQRGPLVRIVTDGRRLLVNGHHAVVDAWSVRNVWLELLEVLSARRSGKTPALEPLRSSLAEAVDTLRKLSPAADVAWFRARLEGAPPLHLPWTSPIDAPSSGGGALVRKVLDMAATSDVRAKAASSGVTLPAWALAAWIRALFDASGQHDVVVRVAHGKRSARLPDFDRLVGAFADALVVRAEVGVNEDTAAIAKRVQAYLHEAQKHEAASAFDLADVVERSVAGPVGITPVGFSFPLLPQSSRIGSFAIEDVVGRAAAGFTRATLVAFIANDKLHLCLNAARSHLSASQMQALVDACATHLVDAPRAALPKTLHGRILERCALHPDRHAIQGLSYGALARRSASLAARLCESMNSSGRIAVLALPSKDAVIAILAILRTGNAYVPLDPHWPDARITQILESSAASSLITTADLAERARSLAKSNPVQIIDERESLSGPNESDATAAYVMYTSGSTGKPKGVVVSHRACLVFQDWVHRAFAVTDADRFAQTSSLAFGGSIRQIFSALLAGASIYPVDHHTLRDPDALVRFLHVERITIWNSVPSLWVHLMDAVERSDIHVPFASVRAILIGGEPVPAVLVRRWRALLPRAVGNTHSCRLFNLYGSVETIVNATWYEVVRDPAPEDVHTPIGWPRFGTPTTLVDVNQNGVGEIAAAGAIAEGYLLDHASTMSSFIGSGVARAYHTGDLAKRLPDGSLVHMGRKDNQVQVRGNRVELVEIEHTIVMHPAVRHAVVTWNDGRLVAAIELVEGAAAPDLREFVEARLPAFMVPNRFDIHDKLPRTPAGKADRIKLRTEPKEFVETDVHAALVSAWRDVLALDADPRPEDDFFALGGDSIRALEVLDHIRARLGSIAKNLRPLELYRHRRFSALEDALRMAIDKMAPIIARASTSRAAQNVRFGLTAVQRGFWLAQQTSGKCPTWSAAIPLEGDLDIAALRSALSLLVERHSVLRTKFSRSSRGVEQEVLTKFTAPNLEVVDLVSLDEQEARTRIDAVVEAASSQSFDPERPPLFAWWLVRRAANEHVLVLCSHHIVSDAWSCFSLLNELCVTHDAIRLGQTPMLPALPLTLADVVHHERQTPTSEELSFWRKTLDGFEQGPASLAQQQVSFIVQLPSHVRDAIFAKAREGRTSAYVVALHLFAEALADVTSSSDLVISTAVSGRDSTTGDLSRVVGPFARALPVRIRAPLQLADVMRALDDAMAHADVPPHAIVTLLGPSAIDTLGRYFMSWLDPSAIRTTKQSSIVPHFVDSRFHFATGSTRTEVMMGIMPHHGGMTLHVHGAPIAERVAQAFELRAKALLPSSSALVVYAPPNTPIPITEPIVVERVTSRFGTSDVVLLPMSADKLTESTDLEHRVRAAVLATNAPVVALAGMLPALTGLGTHPLAGLPLEEKQLTTGHAATVAAMFLTVKLVLDTLGKTFADMHVGALGFGSIGRATSTLCRILLGEPASFRFVDPRVSGSSPSLENANLILGATSGGAVIDVDKLAPGTIVIDDSFPRAFSDEQAWKRMRERRDVLLVGGGMIHAGPLLRTSPFAQAAAVRARLPILWLPGCHAEAVLLAERPELSPTRGMVDETRAREVLGALQSLGMQAAPLHLGPQEIPQDVIDGMRRHRRSP